LEHDIMIGEQIYFWMWTRWRRRCLLGILMFIRL